MIIQERHSVTLIRPAVVKDDDNNATSLDYENPDVNQEVRGMFQTRNGRVTKLPDGNFYSMDAMFYTHHEGAQVDDIVVFTQGTFTGRFRVLDASPKFDLNGNLSHYQLTLTKEEKR